jgi:isoquinoline 1-oxidoreductase alpha subunit
VDVTINGKIYTVADSPNRPLLWVLRDELGLTGTKVGCAAGFCGACTVQIDGEARRSCGVMLESLAGAQVRTVEGLAGQEPDGSPRLHPVQRAFLEAQVPQCGWCMSGQMMTAAAFLERTPDPSDEQIVEAMGRNYCRCGCYARIKTAVRQAAQTMARAEEAV